MALSVSPSTTASLNVAGILNFRVLLALPANNSKHSSLFYQRISAQGEKNVTLSSDSEIYF
jgi:hypothetical protein